MDQMTSLPESRSEISAASIRSQSPSEFLLRLMSMFGCLGALILIGFAFLSRPNNVDLLLLSSGLGLLLASILALFMKKVNIVLKTHLFLFVLFTAVQLLFIHFGWSAQSLLPWLAFLLISNAFSTAIPSRIWFGLGVFSLLIWFLFANSGQVSQTIVISQNSLILDASLLLLVGIVGTLMISVYRQAFAASLLRMDQFKRIDQLESLNAESRIMELQNNLELLNAAAEITRSFGSTLDPVQLIQHAADKIKAEFDLYYVGVFLIDSAHEYAVLRYGTGEEGRRMTANRHRLAVGGYSMIGWTTQTHQSRLALDIGEEAVHFDNPELPQTRSELSLPLQTGNGILGAMTIQSTLSNAFSAFQVDLLQQIVDSLAVTLENATLFDRTQQTLEETRIINQTFVQQAWGEKLDQAGNLKIAYENPKAASASEQTSMMKIPLLLRNEVIGYINLEVEGGELQPDQEEFIQTISAQTSSALENARLIEETQRTAAQEQKLNQISAQFSRALTIDEILRSAVAEFGNLPAVAEASISLIPPDEIEKNPIGSADSEVNS